MAVTQKRADELQVGDKIMVSGLRAEVTAIKAIPIDYLNIYVLAEFARNRPLSRATHTLRRDAKITTQA